MVKEETDCDTISPQELHTTYAAMVEEADIGILIIQNNLCVFANPRVYRMSGYSEEEMVPRDICEKLHPDDREYTMERIRKRLSGETIDTQTIELRLLQRSGEYRWVEARSITIDWLGEPAVLAFVTDIDERKQAERQIAEHQTILASISEASDLLVVIIKVLDSGGFTYSFVSKAFERVTGIPCETFTGLDPGRFVPLITPENAEEITKLLTQCTTTGETRSAEVYHTAGPNYWWYVTFAPVKNDTGRVHEIIGTIINITQRKRYEAELKKYQSHLEELVRERTRQTEQQTSRLLEVEGSLETVIHSIPDGIIIVDSDDIIRLANPAASSILYDTGNSLIGLRFPYKLTEEGQELDITLESGKIRSLALRVVRLMWQDRPCRLAVFRDVTVRKQDLQKIKSLSQRLLEVQEKDRREMGNVLHDEVGGTITILRLATDRVRRELDGRNLAGLDDIDNIITELANQVRFISYSMRPTMLDDYGLEETIHWYIERYRERTGIDITFTHHGLETRLPSQIETTAYRIIQEALTNIAKHSGTENIEVDLSFRKKALSAAVRDTGQGFDPASETRGIGLRQMQDLAELAGGSFSVKSAPGRGTTIGFRLPVSEKTG